MIKFSKKTLSEFYTFGFVITFTLLASQSAFCQVFRLHSNGTFKELQIFYYGAWVPAESKKLADILEHATSPRNKFDTLAIKELKGIFNVDSTGLAALSKKVKASKHKFISKRDIEYFKKNSEEIWLEPEAIRTNLNQLDNPNRCPQQPAPAQKITPKMFDQKIKKEDLLASGRSALQTVIQENNRPQNATLTKNKAKVFQNGLQLSQEKATADPNYDQEEIHLISTHGSLPYDSTDSSVETPSITI